MTSPIPPRRSVASPLPPRRSIASPNPPRCSTSMRRSRATPTPECLRRSSDFASHLDEDTFRRLTERYSGYWDNVPGIFEAEVHPLEDVLTSIPDEAERPSPPDWDAATIVREMPTRDTLGKAYGGFNELYEMDPMPSQIFKSPGLRKRLYVVWAGLTVKGIAPLSLTLPTFMDTVLNHVAFPVMAVLKYLFFKNMPSRDLLHEFNGFLKAGEMCLVLGRPGSGCTTFLKTISNHRQGFRAVDGSVTYSGIDAQEFAKSFRGEAIYCEEEENHFPSLNVAQTLDFALSLKSPASLPPGTRTSDWKVGVMDALLEMFAIGHTRSTLVGSAMVRGVSGGERKRVSLAEVLASRMTLATFDNSTRGLDASTALDYAKSMRILTDTLDLTTFASLYQAGEGIWEQFDKVLIIDQGRCIYFGPRQSAREYFRSLGFADMPRQTSPDYCCGCTDATVRQFVPGKDESTVPCTPEQLEEAYKSSSIYHEMTRQRLELESEIRADPATAEEFRAAVRKDKHRGVGTNSSYTSNFAEQVYYLTKRQIWIKLGARLDLGASIITAFIVAVLCGTVFHNISDTSLGAFNRGGVIFMSLLFNSMEALAELPTQMTGRPVLYKQQSFAFFRPSAMPLAQLISDIPFAFVRVGVFAITVWLLALMHAHQVAGIPAVMQAGKCLFFFSVIFVTYLAMTSLFRIFGTVCKNFHIAAKASALVIALLINFSGYLVPRSAMAPWLQWIPFVNCLNYGFKAIMISEFESLNMLCVGQHISPRNPPDGPAFYPSFGMHQTCTLPGAMQGQQIVPGAAYIKAAFGYDAGTSSQNAAIVFIWFVAFASLTWVLAELLVQGQSMGSLIISKKRTKEEIALDFRLEERREQSRSGKVDPATMQIAAEPLTWRNLTYAVQSKGKRLQLLNGIDGYCAPGHLTALMGTSGAGKTTLLDVLADRKSVGVISGDRLCNGRPVGVGFQRNTAYAEQLDIHEPTATVREALRFSAYLRQPASTSLDEKNRYVEEILELLDMQDIANAIIGMPEMGLGLTDRKKLTIGVELAAKPDLLLFLDEPTTGLDGQAAYSLVKHLRRLAAAGQAIVCTIHQPNSLLFEQFDRLLLLQRGGEVVYFGDIGRHSCHVVEYFAANGTFMQETANPAEAMLDAIMTPREDGRSWAQVYLESDLYRRNLAKIDDLNASALQSSGNIKKQDREYASSFTFQMKQVLNRSARASWRQPDYQFTRLFQHGVIALMSGLLWPSLGNSEASIQYRIFDVFILTVIPAVILTTILPMYLHYRGIFQREYTSRMYSPQVFALTQVLAEFPYCMACGTLYFLVNYFMVFVNPDNEGSTGLEPSKALYFLGMTLAIELFSTTLGQLVGAASPNMFVAGLTIPFLTTWFNMLCGVTVPRSLMPAVYGKALAWINPFLYAMAGMTINALSGLKIRCQPLELSTFVAPDGQTCIDYAQPFLQAHGGYLAAFNETITVRDPRASNPQTCMYCPFSRGEDFLVLIGIDAKEQTLYLIAFFAFVALNILLLVVTQSFIKYSNR